MDLPRTKDLPEWAQAPVESAGRVIRDALPAVIPGPLRPASMMVPEAKLRVLIDLLRGEHKP